VEEEMIGMSLLRALSLLVVLAPLAIGPARPLPVQAQAGKVKVLAVTNRARAAGAPDIPTVSEAGFPGLNFDGLTGIFGPRSMPKEPRDRIAADVAEAAKDPEIVQRLTATGQVIVPGTGAEFGASIEEQRAQVAKVVKALDIKPAQ
jgi:tripartite-type tricarboxylate transporter receptor subunit TctC